MPGLNGWAILDLDSERSLWFWRGRIGLRQRCGDGGVCGGGDWEVGVNGYASAERRRCRQPSRHALQLSRHALGHFRQAFQRSRHAFQCPRHAFQRSRQAGNAGGHARSVTGNPLTAGFPGGGLGSSGSGGFMGSTMECGGYGRGTCATGDLAAKVEQGVEDGDCRKTAGARVSRSVCKCRSLRKAVCLPRAIGRDVEISRRGPEHCCK